MLSLVVPTYNERHNLPTLLERLEAALADCGEPFEVIVVDDDSPDGTSAAARSLQSRFPWLQVLTRKHQRDLSTAVLAGWFEGRGDILGVIDGDLQHPPELLPTLLHRLKETGADLEIASRHVRGGGVSRWSPLRRLISWVATLMAGFVLPGTLSRVRDPMSGFFLVRRAVIEGAPLRPVGYKILLEVLAKGEYQKVVEVTGLEPSQWAAGVARSRGLNVHEGLLAENNLPPESFDLITVWDAIEHFGDPRAEVNHLAHLLKPGGLLALSTMDVESGFARLLGPRWPWFMRMHLYYFSPDTLRALLAQSQLEVARVRRHRRIVSARYLLEKAATQFPRAGGALALVARLPLLGRLHLRVNFGDIINVYAVKTAEKPPDQMGSAADTARPSPHAG